MKAILKFVLLIFVLLMVFKFSIWLLKKAIFFGLVAGVIYLIYKWFFATSTPNPTEPTAQA